MKRRVPIVSESAQTVATNARRRRQAERSVVQVQRLLLATQPLAGFGGALERLDLLNRGRLDISPGSLTWTASGGRRGRSSTACWMRGIRRGQDVRGCPRAGRITRELDSDATRLE